jgi:hypothetical protein
MIIDRMGRPLTSQGQHRLRIHPRSLFIRLATNTGFRPLFPASSTSERTFNNHTSPESAKKPERPNCQLDDRQKRDSVGFGGACVMGRSLDLRVGVPIYLPEELLFLCRRRSLEGAMIDRRSWRR